MDIQKEREEFEKFKAKQIGVDYEVLKKDLDDCERRFPNNRYAGWNFKSDWELWQSAKSQAVPEGFENGRLQDRITELLDERQELYAQLNTGTTKGFTLVQKDLIQSIHQSCVNSLIAESMPAFKAVANTIIYELSPIVKAIQAEAQEQSHD